MDVQVSWSADDSNMLGEMCPLSVNIVLGVRDKLFRILLVIVSALPAHLQVKHGSSDEAFVSKESSQEELRLDHPDRRLLDSDESSGIPEDDIDTTAHIKLRSTVSLPSVSATQSTAYYPYFNNSAAHRVAKI
ncbi:hypothetical protein NQ318_009218 [Aromia moschata]|uniref:Uncharacterized protein n=1 Tax=Aromia moschata TaxID=1265417 RepID=A0AAV8XPC3_9CUCU|nr:hypothetical protein NQ318_009218 [Aromia moschata]